MQASRYVVMTAPVVVPGTRRSYTGSRVVVVELEPGFTGTPPAIRGGAPGVRRIVRDYGECASTARADALAARLSAGSLN